ncbi:TIP41-domain-containing protein, partial [Metschnikowia bicuspidata var. bicuspidata NRRL YB-4993]
TAQVSVPATSHTGPCTNPRCAHCGTVVIPSPKATLPLREQPSITVNDWSIYTSKGPICLSEELDHLNDTRFDFPLPEMIFGNNRVLLVNEKTGARIDFNTLDALDSLAPTADFKVAYYKEWLSTRPKAKTSDTGSVATADGSFITMGSETPSPSPELQSVKPYDWTYSTNYRGTLSRCTFTKTAQDIPLEKLVRPDPILFYDESILFEDELGDNGISMLSTKIRVMHSCLLLLCRFSMRVDDVAFRIRDTRVYIDLETNVVLREYKTQQALYDELLGKVSGRSTDPKKLLRDSNWVSQNTPVVLREVEVME